MSKYLKYGLLFFLLILAGTVAFFIFKKLPSTQTSNPSIENYSAFTHLIASQRQIVGYVRSHDKVKPGIRPTCEGEYYLDSGDEVVWLVTDGSSKQDRQNSYSKYQNKKVEIRGTYRSNGNNCDDEGARECTCYEVLLVEDIKESK